MLRAGRTLGVLVVQNRSHRAYAEEEVEALQTTAMVLAEMFASGEMEDLAIPGADLDLNRPVHLKGTAFAEGIALGHVVLHEPRVVVTELIAEDVEHELRRLDAAMASLKLSVDDLLARGAEAGTGEHREILEAYKMFAEDRGWARRLQEAIRNGLTAEAAVERVQNDTRAQMARQTDPFLRDRLHDFDDLANRLLRELMGTPARPVRRRPAGATPSSSRATWGRRSCSTTTASGCAAWCWRRAARPAMSRSSRGRSASPPSASSTTSCRWPRPATRSSSTAIPARCISGRPPTSRPPMPTRRASAPASRSSTGSSATSRRSTRDGVAIALHINAGLLMDMPRLEESGAAGVGLFRTELQFMVASSFPRLSEQESLLPAGARRGERQARHLPLARCRRRQGAALFPPAEGREPGDGLAGDPARPRPAGAAPHADARAPQGGGRAASSG